MPDKDARNLQILFGLALTITPRTTKNKNELPAARIHRQCNPRAIEVAFLSAPAIDFLPKTSSKRYRIGILLEQGLESLDATVKDDRDPLPATFLLHDVSMFGCTKPTNEVTAVAQTSLQVSARPGNL